MRFVLFAVFASLLAFTPVPASRAQEQPPANAASVPPPTSRPVTADLYIFNDSGPTLLPSNRVISDNGVKLVSLPRQAYAKLQVQPGPHLLKPDPPLWKQQVRLDAIAGSSYFVLVAYRPERSWAAPLAGAPLILREITEAQAEPLLKEMKAQ